MEFGLNNKTAIISGGAGYIGKVYVSALLKNGADVIIIDRSFDKKSVLNELQNEFKVSQSLLKRIKFFECDITKKQEINNVFKNLTQLKKLKILINNASLVKQVGNDNLVDAYKPFLSMEPNEWEEYFSVDLTGTLLLCQKCIPLMKKNGGGTIINISSTYGILSPDQRLYDYFNKKLTSAEKKKGIKIEKPVGYSISKSGILNLTRFLATKFAKDKIRVNTLTLGGVYNRNPTEFVKEYSKRTPLGRMADRNEYSGPLLFLASEMSSYMTGSNLIVDGGWSAW